MRNVINAMLGARRIRTNISFGASDSLQQSCRLGILLESSGFLKISHRRFWCKCSHVSLRTVVDECHQSVGMAKSVVIAIRINMVGIKLNMWIIRNPNEKREHSTLRKYIPVSEMLKCNKGSIRKIDHYCYLVRSPCISHLTFPETSVSFVKKVRCIQVHFTVCCAV